MSETMAPTHSNPMDRPKLQCIGIPFFDTDARIIDPETLEEIGNNGVGEIVVHGPQVFLAIGETTSRLTRHSSNSMASDFFVQAIWVELMMKATSS